MSPVKKQDGCDSFWMEPWLDSLCPASSPVKLARWQEEKAKQAILRAKACSPFYQQHLAKVSALDMARPNWLAQIPFTDAATISKQGPGMLCVPAHEVARIRSIPTSGSTGPAKRIFFTEGDLDRTARFFDAGMRHMVQPGQEVAVMMSSPQEGSVADLLEKGLERFGAKARFCGQVHNAEQAAQEALGAACLVGLPSEMLYLCRKAPHLRPKTVLLSADYVSPAVVQALQQAWGCQVFSHYGLTETGYGLAVQCPCREGHHLRAAEFLVEIICPKTGAVLPVGQEGELVLTSLCNEALPLLRYRTGDITSLLAQPCPCGSVHPRLGPVRGRYTHLQEAVNIYRLDDLLFSLPGMVGYEASWERETLCLLVEGPVLPEQELRDRLGVPLKVEYGPVKLGGREKRRVGGAFYGGEPAKHG